MTEVKTARGENFPVALRVRPARTRRHLMALYGYARFVDDLGDEPGRGAAADRLAALDDVEAQVRGVYQGREPGHPVLAELAATVRACDLPAEPLLKLIEANRIDQITTRYGTFEQLVDYCDRSANPVGELVLHVFGQASAERVALSNMVCTALQVIEHLQDVAEDWQRGRLYLPKEDLDRFGVAPGDLDRAVAARAEPSGRGGRRRYRPGAGPGADPPLRNLIAFEAERARAYLDSGAPLVSTLRGWARLAVGGYVAGGRAALSALARSGYDPLFRPVKAGKGAVLRQWLVAGLRSAG